MVLSILIINTTPGLCSLLVTAVTQSDHSCPQQGRGESMPRFRRWVRKKTTWKVEEGRRTRQRSMGVIYILENKKEVSVVFVFVYLLKKKILRPLGMQVHIPPSQLKQIGSINPKR